MCRKVDGGTFGVAGRCTRFFEGRVHVNKAGNIHSRHLVRRGKLVQIELADTVCIRRTRLKPLSREV